MHATNDPALAAQYALERATTENATLIITADHWPRTMVSMSTDRLSVVEVQPKDTVEDVLGRIERHENDS